MTIETKDKRRFDSTKTRGDFVTQIGVGKVIKGISYPDHITFIRHNGDFLD